MTARRVTRFHAVSSHVSEVMSRRLRIAPQRIEVIPRGRNVRELGTRTEGRRAEARARLGLDANATLIVAVARHEHQKGLDVLLEAMPEVLSAIPSARLVVAGREGNQTVELQAAMERLGLATQAELLGARSDVPELLCAADVFAFPSRWEGLPGALLEAMALEAPIVASDLQAVREAIDGESAGWLVPQGDADRLSGALLEALRDRRESARRAQFARARFEAEFTIDQIADRMVDFYKRALTTRT